MAQGAVSYSLLELNSSIDRSFVLLLSIARSFVLLPSTVCFCRAGSSKGRDRRDGGSALKGARRWRKERGRRGMTDAEHEALEALEDLNQDLNEDQNHQLTNVGHSVPSDDDTFAPGVSPLPPPGPRERGHSHQRHTAAGNAALTTTDKGNTVAQRANLQNHVISTGLRDPSGNGRHDPQQHRDRHRNYCDNRTEGYPMAPAGILVDGGCNTGGEGRGSPSLYSCAASRVEGSCAFVHDASSILGAGAPFLGEGGPYLGQGASSLGKSTPFVGEGGPFVGEGGPFLGEGGPFVGEGGPFLGEGAPFLGKGAHFLGEGGPFLGEGGPFLGKGAPFLGDGGPFLGKRAPFLGKGGPSLGEGGPFVGEGGPFLEKGAPFLGEGGPFVEEGYADQSEGSGGRKARVNPDGIAFLVVEYVAGHGAPPEAVAVQVPAVAKISVAALATFLLAR